METRRTRTASVGGAAAGVVLGVVLAVITAGPAPAQTEGGGAARAEAEHSAKPGPFSVRTGLGFSLDPDSFALAFEGDYAFTDAVSAGILLELGLGDDLLFVSPVGYARYRFDLGSMTDDGNLRRLHPYVQAGLGLTHFDRDAPPGVNEDDTELLLNPGFGVEYEVDPNVSVVSQMLFNIIPHEVFGKERFYFSWEVLSVRYRF